MSWNANGILPSAHNQKKFDLIKNSVALYNVDFILLQETKIFEDEEALVQQQFKSFHFFFASPRRHVVGPSH